MPVEIESLIIDPRTVKKGCLQEDDGPIDVIVAKGRNGKDYFMIGSVQEILNLEPLTQPICRILYGGKDNFGYRFVSERRLHNRFVERSPEEYDDYAIGVDCQVKDGALKYNYKRLAVWVIFGKSKYPISVQ